MDWHKFTMSNGDVSYPKSDGLSTIYHLNISPDESCVRAEIWQIS